MNYWINYPKFMVSLLKAPYGDAARKDNDFGYAWLPKVDGNYSWMYIFDDMYRGGSTRARGQGARPRGPHHLRHEPGGTGTELEEDGGRALEAEVAGGRRERGDGDGRSSGTRPASTKGRAGGADPDRSLPASRRRASPRRTARSPTPPGGCSGSGRPLDPPGQAKADQEILARMFLAVRDLYREGRRRAAEQVLSVALDLHQPAQPGPRRGAAGDERQGAGRRPRPERRDQVLKAAGQQLDGFGQLQDDGTTLCGNWLALRRLHRGRQQLPSAVTTPTRPASGCSTSWGFSWPANRRVMYNRASADAEGKPWDPQRVRHRAGTARCGSATCRT